MRERVANRRGVILDAATHLFSREGYGRVTTKQLAESSGVTEPALYRHFKSKEDIYDAVLEGIGERLQQEEIFDSLRLTNDVGLLLLRLSEHIVEFVTENDDIYRLLLYAALSGHSRAKRSYQMIRGNYVKFLTHQLDRLFKAGLIVEKNNEITSRCFVGMVFDCALGVTLWRNYIGKIYDPVDVIANNVPIYARGLAK
jgi:AcrR family transcriptional regulator